MTGHTYCPRHILVLLHDCQRGTKATKRSARQVKWWDGINSDITKSVKECDICQMLPSQLRKPLFYNPLPSHPFLDVSADRFTHADKDYHIYRGSLSGWPCVEEYGWEAPPRTTVKLLLRLF